VSETEQPLVGVVMGSDSDWPTMEKAVEVLEQFGVPYEARVVSAHRTPELLVEYSKSAQERGLKVIIAGAGGSAHLPGMVASMTILPVLGVPVKSRALSGMDSLLSIVQMPKGIPVATFAIGDAGAGNAGLSAVSILATSDQDLACKLQDLGTTNGTRCLKKFCHLNPNDDARNFRGRAACPNVVPRCEANGGENGSLEWDADCRANGGRG
jgi:5-(carboxyamino)imidazole ribonucleotide mutase